MGMPSSGELRGKPLLAPVVVNVMTGTPASSPANVVRPFVASSIQRSIGARILESVHAPGGVEPSACIPR